MNVNLPPNIPEDVRIYFKEFRDQMNYYHNIVRGKIFNNLGSLVWEEPVEEYQERMSRLFYEVK